MVISIFEPHSIYAMRLAREGKLLTHHTDKSILTLMNMDSVIEKNVTTVKPGLRLGKLVNVLSNSDFNYLPVVDDDRHLLGEIDLLKIRHIVFRTELYQKYTAAQLMTPVSAFLYNNEPMEKVMKKFDKTNAEALPVVDINNHLVGYISRLRLYSVYRKMVADYSAE